MALRYANTDRIARSEFSEYLVQEWKHCEACRVSFAMLKRMLASFGWMLSFPLLLFVSMGATSPITAEARPIQAKKPASKPEENTLAHEIRHQLQVLPYYSVFDYLTFTLDDGKVTLTGHVLRHSMRNDAEAAIRSIEGVSSVTNLIEILPKSQSDDDLRRAVYRAIYEDSELQRYAVSELPSVHIIVKDGTVTLEGTVETDGDRKLATSRSSGVSGVSIVSNNLVVRTKNVPAN